MTIIDDLLPERKGVRTGHKLAPLKGLVVHWIGVPQPSARVIRRNFERSRTGTHYIIDHTTGEIIRCVPEDEVCYHVGASAGYRYTNVKRAICGEDNPNWDLVGIECCISAGDNIPEDYAAPGKYMDLGKPSEVQYEALVEFCADFLGRHGLTVDDLYLHNDIVNKACHVWFVKDRQRWAEFKARVAERMEENEMIDIGKLISEMTNEQAYQLTQKAELHARTLPEPDWSKEQGHWQRAVDAGVTDGSSPERHMKRDEVMAVLGRAGLF